MEKNVVSKNYRIDWIDIAKGLGIIFVVIGHSGLTGYWSNWIWSFHMPLFFFLSGILFNKKYSFIQLTKKHFRTLILPYIVFTIIIIPFWVIFYNKNLFQIVFFGWTGMALWFLPVLFLVEIIYKLTKKIKTKTFLNYIFLLFFLLIGYTLQNLKIHLPYKLEVVFYSLFFFGLGNLINKNLLNRKYNYLLSSLIPFLLLSLFFAKINIPKLDLASNQIGKLFPGIIGALSGIGVIIIISKIIEKVPITIFKNSLIFLGKNTLIILALHQTIMHVLIKLFANTPLNGTLSSIIRHSLMWLLLMLFIFIINNYFPFVLGKSNSKK